MEMTTTWDCVVVGAGAAGLSAALVLGRARRATLVVDAGAPSNAPSPGVGGLLGHDRRPPAALYATGREELAEYPTVHLRAGEVVRGEHDGNGGFAVTLADGTEASARRLLLATGAEYVYPQLPGVAERWGHSVFHCPFCHGWEHRDAPLAVLGADAMAAHRALLLRAWSAEVALLTNGPAELGAADRAALTAAGIDIDERPVAALHGPSVELDAIAFTEGGERACRGLLVPVTLRQRSPLAVQLGAELAPPGPVGAEALAVTPMGATTIPGLSAAGDATTQTPSVAGAVASGSSAAAGLVGSLMTDRTVPSEPATA